MGERVLLAGCGDLGLRAARLLRDRGDTVFALRRHPPADPEAGMTWIRADLRQADTLRALPPDVSTLVYLASPDRHDACAYGAVFADGLRNAVTAVAGASLRRVLFVSSSAVYGDHGGAWVDEETPVAPQGYSGSLQADAEQWLASQRVPSVVLRLAGLYGPHRVQLLERLRAGLARAPRGAPHWANRVHVDDAAAAVAHLVHVEDPRPVYLGVDDTPLPLDVLYDALAAMLGASRAPDGPPPPGIGNKRLRNARLRASGWVPRWRDARAGYAALLGVPDATRP